MSEQELEILLAEDDPGHARLIQSNLRDVCIQNKILHFKDGQEIIDFLWEKHNGHETVDFSQAYLLLLDIRMPKLSGDEVLKRIKEHPDLKVLPVIMLTTTDDPTEVRRCHELGCNEYVTKPVEYSSFVEVIKRVGMFLQIVRVPPVENARGA